MSHDNEWRKPNVRYNGIYLDRSTKGRNGGHHYSFRAELRIDGRRVRKRFNSYAEAEAWYRSYEG